MMIKIKKEKTIFKNLDEVQKKASARLVNKKMILAFVERKIKAVDELNLDINSFDSFLLDSADELGDNAVFYAGHSGGIRVEKSRTKIKMKIEKNKNVYTVEILKIERV